MPTFRQALGAAVIASGVAVATVAAPAQADPLPPFQLTYNAAATTTVKKLNQEVDFPTTTFVPTVTLSETGPNTVIGPLNLPPATTSLKLGSLNLVTITLQVDHASNVNGTATIEGPVWTINATQSFQVHLTKISPLGVTGINLVGSQCRTTTTTASLSGTLDFSKIGQPGGPDNTVMSGSYTIPKITGCGLLTPILNALISGPSNPISVHLTMGSGKAAQLKQLRQVAR